MDVPVLAEEHMPEVLIWKVKMMSHLKMCD